MFEKFQTLYCLLIENLPLSCHNIKHYYTFPLILEDITIREGRGEQNTMFCDNNSSGGFVNSLWTWSTGVEFI